MNDLVVPDGLVSGEHCRVEARPGGHTVVDLASFAGTFVNGRPVAEAVLCEGDTLTVGDRSLAVRGSRLVPRAHGGRTLDMSAVEYSLRSGQRLLGPMSLRLPEGSLTAIVGPSGAGKSTLLGTLTGSLTPTAGEVTWDGLDVHSSTAYFRSRIGVVPQEDVTHRQLQPSTALTYAAALRFAPDLDGAERDARVGDVLDQLQLRDRAGTRIDRLSGGQRKRVSIASELLTEPELLFLDEPTSGLDLWLDKSVMTLLRTLADRGRTVVVVTHAVTNLQLCDNVLVLASPGRCIYLGPPSGLASNFGTGDLTDIFERISASPERFADHVPETAPRRATVEPPTSATEREPEPPVGHQVRTLIRRQVDLLLADRSLAIFTAVLPVALGMLSWAIPGDDGLAPPAGPTSESMQMLVILIVGSVFMGMSGTVRDLVAERTIFRRERAVGLSPRAYLTAKATVAGSVAAIQSAVLVVVVALGKAMPSRPVALPLAVPELWVTLTLTTAAGAAFGLLLSSLVSSSDQVMPLLVGVVMTQMILCAGLVPVAGRPVLAQLAAVAPARWGFAAAASSVGVLDALDSPREDALWEPYATTWLFDLLMLGLLTAAALLITLRRLERK
jgi:ABC-type multidrug transport system ATPase subunit